LAAFYCFRLVPEFQSVAKVLVVKKRNDTLPVAGVDPRNNYIDDYLGTHQNVIKSPMIVDDAFKKRELKALESLRNSGDATAEVIRSLNVTVEAAAFRRFSRFPPARSARTIAAR